MKHQIDRGAWGDNSGTWSPSGPIVVLAEGDSSRPPPYFATYEGPGALEAAAFHHGACSKACQVYSFRASGGCECSAALVVFLPILPCVLALLARIALGGRETHGTLLAR